MPIYEFACTDCRRNFEFLLRSPQDPPVCPHCFSSRAERRLSSFTICGRSGKSSDNFAENHDFAGFD